MKKNVSLLLLAALTLSAASCGGGGTSVEGTASVSADTETTAALSEAESAYQSLPDEKYGGYKFKAIAYSDATSPLSYFHCETQTGDVIDDAVFARNRTVEERYEVEFAFTAFSTGAAADMAVEMRKSVMAGDNAYDLYITHTSKGPIGMLTDNLVYNWREVPYVELDKPWWSQNTIKQVEMMPGYLPFAVSDFDLPAYAFATALIFNKKMVGSYSLDDPYELVRSGKWTLDTFAAYIKNCSRDVDGNGVYDDKDSYGFASNITYHPQAFPTSCDIRFVEKDPATGYPKLSVDIEKFSKLLGVLNTAFNVDKTTFRTPHDELCPIPYDEDRVLITLVWLAHLESYRDSNSDYGIIPLPKYDEKQDEYYTLVNRRGCVFALPINAENIGRTGTLIEALSILSYQDVVPTYYSSILNAKYTRDEESVEMLELINAGKRYDFGYFYPTANTANAILTLLNEGSTDVSSYFAKNQAAGEAYYENIYQMYLKNSK